MTLEDFERSLAESRERRERSHRDRDRSESGSRERSRHHRHHHHHHHRHHRHHSSRSRERERDRDRHSRRDDEDDHRHKRSRHASDNGDDPEHTHKRRHRRGSVENKEPTAPKEIVQQEPAPLKRDAWMEDPSALEFDYVHKRGNTRLQEPPQPKMLQADFDLKLHERELNSHLRDLKEGKPLEDIKNEPAQHEVDYTFGDAGSQWRMTKLRAVYREAEETGRPVEDVAIERYGDLRAFDDAREEEIELDRRERYGESYVGKEKPTGELFQERKLKEGIKRQEHHRDPEKELETKGQGQPMETEPHLRTTQPLDLTALNRLRAQMMKAKLKGSADAAELEERYNIAASAHFANRKEADVIVLGVRENRMLAGERNEVRPVETKRGRERGQVEENEDMSILDMVREERRTRGEPGGEGRQFAERIMRDPRFEVSVPCLRLSSCLVLTRRLE